MSESLPLVEGARPCVQCGFCCKQTTCGAAEYDHTLSQCEALIENDDGTYSCGKYDEILEMPKFMWEMMPAFGAGCCSAMNSDRQRIIRNMI
jgi:hypothetical protein